MWKSILLAAGAIPAGLISTALVGNWRFHRQVHREVRRWFDGLGPGRGGVIGEPDWAKLPAPLQRYLRFTRIEEQPVIRTVRLKQVGRLRLSPAGRWIPFRAEQAFSVNPPGFVWWASVGGILQAVDRYERGEGRLQIKLLGLIKVGEAAGPELTQAELVRYLSEMIWFPFGYLGGNLQFEPMDDTSVRVILRDHGRTVSGVMEIRADGSLAGFRAPRYRETQGNFQLEDWVITAGDWQEVQGIRVPLTGTAAWKSSAGEFEYIRLRIVELEFDPI